MLDAYQQSAAHTNAKRVIVTSPPGSGKTSTLVERLKYMLDELHLTPSRIACITFTRMAANEIKERMGSKARGAYIGTLHGFCLQMLMKMGKDLGYEQDWLTILNDKDAELDVKEVLADQGLIKRQRGGSFSWNKVSGKAWEAFMNGVSSGSLSRAESKPEHLALWRAYDGIMARFRAQNVLTFGSILTEAYRLLTECPDALAYFQDQHRHLLVDEAQDTSHIQWSIVWALIQKAQPDSLWIVSDLDQSLYSWRGAVPYTILEMIQSGDYEVHQLRNTYRFGPRIAKPAVNLIRHNPSRVDVEIIAKGRTEGVLTHQTSESADVLAGDIAKCGRPLKDIAVLCRQHAPLSILSNALEARGIDHARIGGSADLKATSEFRAIMGYLRLAANPLDRSAFMAVTASEHLTDSDILSLRDRAVQARTDLVAAYSKQLPKEFEEICGYLDHQDPETDYSEASAYLRKMIHWNHLTTPQDIINFLALSDIQDDVEMAGNSLILCTGHASKGLEWPVVYVIGMNDGICPSASAMKEGNLEEERRIMYVMMTRAREEVHLVTLGAGWQEQSRQRWLKISEIESRFVGEMR